ncbi:ATP-grasp domain-containing protein [Oceanobacillus halotolerans]|uniref:ATP-grasp domain-containing protein n=1 Tax=Oceanobacillus halotolerans TaxID=2663380 RepID=UPI0013D94734|nr:RimK family alpha-L-glutamate ligase [Oceanobacillus halotolerans]
MSLHAWIIYNGHLPSNKFIDFAEWLHSAAIKRNITAEMIPNHELLAFLSGSSLELRQTNPAPLPDFVLFTDKDIYLAKQLELLGIPVFNNAEAISVSDNKITSYQILAQHQLPIPKTIIAPKIFNNHTTIDDAFITNVINSLGFPMIIKEAYGSFGEQVYLIEDKSAMLSKVNALLGKEFVFQEFIHTSYGKDCRLHVVGNQVVASMMRTASDDFRANVTAGGTMKRYNPSPIEQNIAISATKAIGAHFAGVDLLFGKNNNPIICEINSNAHIRNMYDCTSVNVADYIIDYIVKTVKPKH